MEGRAQKLDVCEIKIHGVTFHKAAKPPKFDRKQAFGTLTQELVCLLHSSVLWQANTNTLPSSSGYKTFTLMKSVFLSETSVCNNPNAQSIYITINDQNLELSN
jgi:hypothetical protein